MSRWPRLALRFGLVELVSSTELTAESPEVFFAALVGEEGPQVVDAEEVGVGLPARLAS
jgi:hypothetical protein